MSQPPLDNPGMTPEEARLLLRAARANGADDADPAVAEALALAQRDPELARWLAAERQADLRIAKALDTLVPPVGLKGEILSRMEARKAAAPLVPNIAIPRRHLFRYALYALAALLIASAIPLLAPFTHPSYNHYEGDLAGQIASGEATHLAHQSPDVAQLEQWLAAHHAPSEIDVPGGLHTTPTIGCRTFQWKGRQIGQVCFALDNGKIVHLFIVQNAGWSPSSAPPQGHAQFNRHGEWTLASWRDGTTTYVLAGEGDIENVKKFL